MKNLFFFLLLIAFCSGSSGQFTTNYSLQIPISNTYSSAAIAEYITSNFKTDRDKIEAAYSWVTANIRYDKDSMYNINWGPDASLKVSAALRRKKGVCENFAAVFTDILLKSNITSYVVNGYTIYSKAGHSWSAVLLDKQWLLCDPTWDIGVGNTHYFLISPDEFIGTHIAFDPLWQLLPYPVMQNHFDNNKLSTQIQMSAWNINDSVAAFLKLDSLQQLEASALRMQQTALKINTLKTWQAYTKMKIAIVYGDKDKDLYNAAVADLNKASAIFNNFVQYRNKQFLPLKPTAELSSLLNEIPTLIKAANNKINSIGVKVENDQYDTGNLQLRLHNLSERTRDQQVFLNNYLETSVAERSKLFYK